MLSKTGIITTETKVSEVVAFLQSYITLYGDNRFNVEMWDDYNAMAKFIPYKNELLLQVDEGDDEE